VSPATSNLFMPWIPKCEHPHKGERSRGASPSPRAVDCRQCIQGRLALLRLFGARPEGNDKLLQSPGCSSSDLTTRPDEVVLIPDIPVIDHIVDKRLRLIGCDRYLPLQFLSTRPDRPIKVSGGHSQKLTADGGTPFPKVIPPSLLGRKSADASSAAIWMNVVQQAPSVRYRRSIIPPPAFFELTRPFGAHSTVGDKTRNSTAAERPYGTTDNSSPVHATEVAHSESASKKPASAFIELCLPTPNHLLNKCCSSATTWNATSPSRWPTACVPLSSIQMGYSQTLPHGAFLIRHDSSFGGTMNLTFADWNLPGRAAPETARGAASTTGACRILLAACTLLAAAGCAAAQSAQSAGCPLEDTVPVLGAPQLERAYGEGAMLARGINGSGASVAVVMPYLNPDLRHDLTVYSRRYHLPVPQLTMVDWHHAPAADPSNSFQAGGILEGDADMEMIHAMAPGARLIYVQTPDSPAAWANGAWAGLNLTSALQWLAASPLHPDVISYSEVIPEQDIRQEAVSADVPGQEALSAVRVGIKAAARAGITVVAGAGDSGGGEPEWPASDPLVTAVGGTELHVNAAGERLGPATADTAGCGIAGGGGLSAAFTRPSWQNGVASVTGASRGIPDVSMDASPRSPVQVYDTGSESGWLRASGTSIAAPLFAGLVADAAALAGHPLGCLGPVLYRMHGTADGLQDVTSGTTALPGTSAGYPARTGYSLAAGIGTISNAALFTAALARQASIQDHRQA
jgi:hypothetical protein